MNNQTQLYNRTEFFQEAEQYFDNHKGAALCMVAIDIEHFKLFNRWYGRSLGDQFLMEVTAIIRDFVTSCDGIAGYFGDDDFALLLADEESLLKDLYRQIADYVDTYHNSTGFLPLFGVCPIEDASVPVYSIYDQAVLAFRLFTGNSTIRIRRYDADMNRKLEEEQLLLAEIRQALQDDEFVFYAQPYYHLSTGKIVGAESLIRWKHKTRGIVTPGQFIPFLEERGMITDVDCFIWDKVCRALSNWISGGFQPIPISVNVSRVDFYAIDVVEHFQQLVKKYQINPRYLEIEVTESAYAENNEFIADVIRRLREAGFTVLIDDFGSGYSSLNMLKNVNADILKIDTKFLDIDDQCQEKGEGIIEAIVNMARMMNMSIITEGVENKQQRDFLYNIGCRYAQGYYFSYPLPVPEFEKLLLTHDTVDYHGIQPYRGQSLRISELLNTSMFSEVMVNNILGAVALFHVGDDIHLMRGNTHFYHLIDCNVTPDTLINTFLQNIYPDDLPVFRQLFEKAEQEHYSGSGGHIRYIISNGDYIWLDLHIFFLKKTDDQKIFYASFSDITEFYQQKRKLEISQKILDSIARAPENNESLMRLTGYIKANITGHSTD